MGCCNCPNKTYRMSWRSIFHSRTGHCVDLWFWRTLNRLLFEASDFRKFVKGVLWRASSDMYWFSTVWEMHWSDTEVVWSTLKYELFCYALAGDVSDIPAVSHSPQLQVESCDCTTITLLAALWAWFIACAMISSCTLNKSGPEQLNRHCYATNSLWMSLSVWISYTRASLHIKQWLTVS